MIVSGKSNVVEESVVNEKTQNEQEIKTKEIRKADSGVKETKPLEVGYYIQSYTCESGKLAKIIIPEDATEDDLFAFEDMLKIVLKRKFKLNS